MDRRGFHRAGAATLAAALPLRPLRVHADASGPALAAYYGLHMALVNGVAWAWTGRDRPRPQSAVAGQRWAQVGVSDEACLALSEQGELWRWRPGASGGERLMAGVRQFAAGRSGWFAIDGAHRLWHAAGDGPVQAVGTEAAQACVGDSADYWVARDGRLWVRGLAHRGQYGDGRLQASNAFVNTAEAIVAVRAHTGHALALRRDGTVTGTGGNRYGPLSRHGLGDKADRWGPIFEGASAIATGSRHSLAVRADGSLWAWGDGFDIEPRRIGEDVTLCAAGDTVTLARTRSGDIVQWERGRLVARHHLA
jgi:alpha-tubulin suppressor-like RCC1 family protein